jgi:hypothetical protein
MPGYRPYTLGVQLVADPGAGTAKGSAYYIRKKRYLAYILTGFLLLFL